MTSAFTIVGLGEALFDVFPDRQVLGGAPLNVAVHAQRLAGPRQGCGLLVSRVGQDDFGHRVVADLQQRNMRNDFIQTDPDHETGRVYVGIDVEGQPEYNIVQNVAWDWLQYDPDLENLARHCEAICFGTPLSATARPATRSIGSWTAQTPAWSSYLT